MSGAMGGQPRNRARAFWRIALAAAVVGGGTLLGALPQRASATLTGSSFNGADASPTTDLAAGAVASAERTTVRVRRGSRCPNPPISLTSTRPSGPSHYRGWQR